MNSAIRGKNHLPSNWEIKDLGDLFDFKNGLNAAKENYGKGAKFINVMEVIYHDSIMADSIPGNVAISDKQLEDFSVIRGDVLFNRTSEITEEVGLTAVYLDDPAVVFGGFVIRGRPKNKTVHDEFKKYCFRSEFVREQIIKGGQGVVRSNIGQGDLEKVKVALPPLPEQKAIASALTLMDSAIHKTNQLIAQKELQKKALMQQLLTGKKRLKGFGGEWKNAELRDCFQFIKSFSISRDGLTSAGTENVLYCIHYGDIHALYENVFLDFDNQTGIPKIVDPNFIVPEKDILKEGDVILADASEDYEGVGEAVEVFNLGTKIAVGGLHTIVLRDNTKFTVNGFRAYLFFSEKVRNELRKKATGTSVYSLTKGTLETLVLNLPGLDEQKAIAQVLQSADKEIQLLKTKSEKLKEQKKGMMQVLLTGKKRLKVAHP